MGTLTPLRQPTPLQAGCTWLRDTGHAFVWLQSDRPQSWRVVYGIRPAANDP